MFSVGRTIGTADSCRTLKDPHMAKQQKNHGGRALLMILIAAALIVAVALWTGRKQRVSSSEEMQKYMSLGSRYLQEQNYEEAITAYNKVLDVQPTNGEAILKLSEAYEKNGDTEKQVDTVMYGLQALDGVESEKSERQELMGTYAELRKELPEGTVPDLNTPESSSYSLPDAGSGAEVPGASDSVGEQLKGWQRDLEDIRDQVLQYFGLQ